MYIGRNDKTGRIWLKSKLRINLSLIWPEIKNTEAGPIWGILIKKYLVYSCVQNFSCEESGLQ